MLTLIQLCTTGTGTSFICDPLLRCFPMCVRSIVHTCGVLSFCNFLPQPSRAFCLLIMIPLFSLRWSHMSFHSSPFSLLLSPLYDSGGCYVCSFHCISIYLFSSCLSFSAFSCPVLGIHVDPFLFSLLLSRWSLLLVLAFFSAHLSPLLWCACGVDHLRLFWHEWEMSDTQRWQNKESEAWTHWNIQVTYQHVSHSYSDSYSHSHLHVTSSIVPW